MPKDRSLKGQKTLSIGVEKLFTVGKKDRKRSPKGIYNAKKRKSKIPNLRYPPTDKTALLEIKTTTGRIKTRSIPENRLKQKRAQKASANKRRQERINAVVAIEAIIPPHKNKPNTVKMKPIHTMTH